MPASKWKVYNDFLLNEGKKKFDFSANNLKCAIVTSVSNALDQNWNGALYTNLTGELPTANGYILGGVIPSSVSWTGGSSNPNSTLLLGTATWIFTLLTIARGMVLYDTISGCCVAFYLFDSTPADFNIPSGSNVIVLGTVFLKENLT